MKIQERKIEQIKVIIIMIIIIIIVNYELF